MQWIWLRGLGRCAEHWGNLPDLARRHGITSVITLDLPGFGRQSHLHCPKDMDALVKGLQGELIGRVKSDESIALMGLSLGGWVAMNWAARDPKVKALVAVNSSSPLSPFTSRLRWRPLLSLLVRALRWHNTPERLEQSIVHWASNRPEFHSQFVDAWHQIAKRFPMLPRQVVHQLRLATMTPMPEQHRLDHCRTLILASAEDRLVNANCSKKLAEYWGADLVMHPDAGHDLSLDDPKWLIEQLITVEQSVLSSQFCEQKFVPASLREVSLVEYTQSD